MTGLIKLRRPLELNQFIQPAKLATNCEIPHLGNQSVIAVGMGRINADEFIPFSERRLRHAYFDTIYSEDCFYAVFDEPNPDSIICAGTNAKRQSTYNGDSGILLIQQSCHHSTEI